MHVSLNFGMYCERLVMLSNFLLEISTLLIYFTISGNMSYYFMCWWWFMQNWLKTRIVCWKLNNLLSKVMQHDTQHSNSEIGGFPWWRTSIGGQDTQTYQNFRGQFGSENCFLFFEVTENRNWVWQRVMMECGRVRC